MAAAERSAAQQRIVALLGPAAHEYFERLADTDRSLSRQVRELFALVREETMSKKLRFLAIDNRRGRAARALPPFEKGTETIHPDHRRGERVGWPVLGLRRLASGARVDNGPHKILDGFADLHELIQTGWLGDESGDSQIFEQGPVPTGLGRTPDAHGNAGEVSGALDFAQDVFAGVLGQVQVHQDQVGNRRVRISPLAANEGESFPSAQQVNQFEFEILLFQRPIEKEDV